MLNLDQAAAHVHRKGLIQASFYSTAAAARLRHFHRTLGNNQNETDQHNFSHLHDYQSLARDTNTFRLGGPRRPPMKQTPSQRASARVVQERSTRPLPPFLGTAAGCCRRRCRCGRMLPSEELGRAVNGSTGLGRISIESEETERIGIYL